MNRACSQSEQPSSPEFYSISSLPPNNPPLLLTGPLAELYGSAMQRLGQFNELFIRSKHQELLIQAFNIKEAQLSSAIESIDASVIELYASTLQAKPSKNSQRVLNYRLAFQASMEMVCQEQFPLAPKPLLKAHELLMGEVESEKSDPGHYRRQDVRLGNVIHAPAAQLPQIMTQLEHYINSDTSHPPLIQAGLAHVQFETIQPFLEGNGRIARLLIPLMLAKKISLSASLICPSYYFKKERLAYYRALDRVRSHGDYEGWIHFYLLAIEMSALETYKRASQMEMLEEEILKRIQADLIFHKARQIAGQMVAQLFKTPVVSIGELSQRLAKSYNATHQSLLKLEKIGYVSEITHHRRNKLFQLSSLLKILSQE